MGASLLAWLMSRPSRWKHLQHAPLRRILPLLVAVFLLFSTTGFYYDLMAGGTLPYAVVLAGAAFGGLDAVVWILALARMRVYVVICLGLLQFFSGTINIYLALLIDALFHPRPVAPRAGIHFAATATLVAVILSYIGFVHFIRFTGREAFRLRTELELAHSIQKTLVPPLQQTLRCFELYGISEPSEKVGGDLVDAVHLEGGDTVVYLADVAGHGLQAGILMGMLKTAARVALLEQPPGSDSETLSMLMDRLNRVLPGVKESHMYATFTCLRLTESGASFFGLAASPPPLHWQASTRTVTRIEEQQFPLGLLPVSRFPASSLVMAPGDLLLIATDGISEVCSKDGVEFGDNHLAALLSQYADAPLHDLARTLLTEARTYGRQLDDQTLLLIRRMSPSFTRPALDADAPLLLA